MKILKEYDLDEIFYMFNKVKNATVPAVLYSIGLILVTMELLLLKSGEYRYLLLRLGHE